MSYAASSRHAYDAIAAHYDEIQALDDIEGLTIILLDLIRQRVPTAIPAGEEGRRTRLVDLGCGTGTVLAAAERQGLEVIGVDHSRAMLNRAALALEATRSEVILLQQPLEALELPRPVDIGLALFDVVNHLVDASSLRQFFLRLREAIRPGGALLFDLVTARHFEALVAAAPYAAVAEDYALFWDVDYNPERGLNVSEMSLFSAEGDAYRRHDLRVTERVIEQALLDELAADAGFEIVAALDGAALEDADARPATLDAWPRAGAASRRIVQLWRRLN